MSEIENVNNRLGEKIISALLEEELINKSIANSFEKQLNEGRVKDTDWITAFTDKFNSTLITDNEA